MPDDSDDSRRARLVSLPLWVYRHRLPILAVLGGALLLFLIVLGSFTTRVVQRCEGRRWNLPSRIYSDLYQVRAGEAAAIGPLTAKLERLYYQKVDGERHDDRSGGAVAAGRRRGIRGRFPPGRGGRAALLRHAGAML